ncbi:hypothetical protein [Lysinibacillus xylanilyticus]|uniref:hypothetical protein n=1 Tax=Lysinibacillus xylanilyticus TaxID=582475 RepID=UPI00382E86B9
MFEATLKLEDLEENRILVKLARNTLFKIGKFYLYNQWDTDGSQSTLTIYVDEKDKEQAKKEIYNFVDLLNFMYGKDLTITTNIYINKVEGLPDSDMVLAEETKNSNILKLNSVLMHLQSLDSKKQKHVLQSLHYFSRSLKLIELELYEEAFLSVFKTIELISNDIYKNYYKDDFDNTVAQVIPNLLSELFQEEYQNSANDKDTNDSIVPILERLITLRRKIKMTLSYLKLNDEFDNFGKLVQLRNQVAAHGTSSNKKIGMREYADCMKLSKKIITTYILGERSNKTVLDWDIKYWWG